MKLESTICDQSPVRRGEFRTTHWSVILQAREGSPRSREALEKICQAYWPPVYAYVCRQGHKPHSAQDLTQEFFGRLLADNSLARAQQDRGRFRSYLLGALKHFLANEWDRSCCLKRGGGAVIFSLHSEGEEPAFEIPDTVTPETIFQRRWAETVLARANARLRREYEAAGQITRFDALKVYLLDGYDPVSYQEMADKLGISEAAVKSAIYKMRQRYGQMLRAEIARTVNVPAEVDEEIRWLLQVLGD